MLPIMSSIIRARIAGFSSMVTEIWTDVTAISQRCDDTSKEKKGEKKKKKRKEKKKEKGEKAHFYFLRS